jgi:glycerate dehydrogenase
MFNITVLDGHPMNPGDLSWEPMKELGHLRVYPRTNTDEVVVRSADADVLVINKIKITEDLLDSLPRLKFICVSATGYNVVDMQAACKHGVIVSNVPSYSTASVAQSVFAHLLNVTNRVDAYATQNRQGMWSESPDFTYLNLPCTELSGKVIGIVGLGHIGRAVSSIAISLGMKVWAYTSKRKEDLPDGVEKKSLDELFAGADVVSLHCPQTQETFGMVNRKRLAQMKPTSILINTARGGLIDESAVAEALKYGTISAFCADVLYEEPPKSDNPLLNLENAYITPHIAWATREARERLMAVCVKNVDAFIKGKPINVVS